MFACHGLIVVGGHFNRGFVVNCAVWIWIIIVITARECSICIWEVRTSAVPVCISAETSPHFCAVSTAGLFLKTAWVARMFECFISCKTVTSLTCFSRCYTLNTRSSAVSKLLFHLVTSHAIILLPCFWNENYGSWWRNVGSELWFLLRSREISGSVTGQQTGYHDWIFIIFLCLSGQMPG